MESAHPFSVSFAPCFQAVLCRSRLFFRMFLDKLFQICADRFIMKQKRRCFSPFLQSPSSRRAWIEIPGSALGVGLELRSPSSRRAWIEIRIPVRPAGSSRVALLAEGVDRNDVEKAKTLNLDVALLAEGVDRNRLSPPRNSGSSGSPSSRRAWIEISAGKMLSMKSSGRPPRGGRG